VRRTALLAPLLVIALTVGCSNEPADTPTACLEGPGALEKALQRAPQPARLEGRIPISDCLVPEQPAGDLMEFGTDAVEVATKLGRQARDPGARGIAAGIRAGYLVGALERGANDTGGIHAILLDRIRNAATNGLSGTARTHFEIGYEAGQRLG
jgi:hypothetical protein